jgi:hypothetical protein
MTLSRRDHALIVASWTGLGLLESVKAAFNARLLGQPIEWGPILLSNMPWWLAWAALTPLVFALGRRVRLDQGGGGAVAVHLAAAAALAILHHVVVGTLYYYTQTRGVQIMIAGALRTMTLQLQLWNFFFGYFVLNVVTYWAALGAYYALVFHRQVRDGEVRAARLEADLHAARLDALRMELNPHFLFNTLNTIAALVEREDRRPAVTMLARLGELLRTTLEQGSDPEVPLERELEFLGIYLEIVSTRFSDRLRVETAIGPGVRGAMVPTLILQPLVENAVRHGVAQRPGQGRIVIGARKAEAGLELTVLDCAEPAEASVPPAGDESGRSRGVGLENTRRRLAQLYGAAAALRLDPLPRGNGTLVTVSLPLAHA